MTEVFQIPDVGLIVGYLMIYQEVLAPFELVWALPKRQCSVLQTGPNPLLPLRECNRNNYHILLKGRLDFCYLLATAIIHINLLWQGIQGNDLPIMVVGIPNTMVVVMLIINVDASIHQSHYAFRVLPLQYWGINVDLSHPLVLRVEHLLLGD